MAKKSTRLTRGGFCDLTSLFLPCLLRFKHSHNALWHKSVTLFKKFTNLAMLNRILWQRSRAGIHKTQVINVGLNRDPWGLRPLAYMLNILCKTREWFKRFPELILETSRLWTKALFSVLTSSCVSEWSCKSAYRGREWAAESLWMSACLCWAFTRTFVPGFGMFLTDNEQNHISPGLSLAG